MSAAIDITPLTTRTSASRPHLYPRSPLHTIGVICEDLEALAADLVVAGQHLPHAALLHHVERLRAARSRLLSAATLVTALADSQQAFHFARSLLPQPADAAPIEKATEAVAETEEPSPTVNALS